jgi:glycosyltransferase involved in cell wall biosynthesis
MLEFLMVIPTLNEQDHIKEIVEKADKLVSSIFKNYTIVVVDESSTDKTVEIVNGLMKKTKNLDLISGRTPGNKGFDIRYAMSKYDSNIYSFIDADLKDTLPYLKNLISEYKKGNDLVIGSKLMNEELLDRSETRNYISKRYNSIINLIFNDKIIDHQCGFKLFSRKAFLLINKHSKERHWLWDTEALLIANSHNLKISEIPVRIIEIRKRPVSSYRIIKDMTLFSTGILRLVYRFKILKDY